MTGGASWDDPTAEVMASALLVAEENEELKKTLQVIADHICRVSSAAAAEGQPLSVNNGIRRSYGDLEKGKSKTAKVYRAICAHHMHHICTPYAPYVPTIFTIWLCRP